MKMYIIMIPGLPPTYILIMQGQIIILLKFRGAKIWNKLPNDLKIIKSYHSFKKNSKVYVRNLLLT